MFLNICELFFFFFVFWLGFSQTEIWRLNVEFPNYVKLVCNYTTYTFQIIIMLYAVSSPFLAMVCILQWIFGADFIW